MKKILLFIFISCFVISCEEQPVVVDDETPVSIVGSSYSGYSFKSVFDGSNMYAGYEFFSADSCYELLIEEDSRIVSREKQAYLLDWPEIKIYDSNAAAGYWSGTFSGDYLLIRSLKLKKW